MIHRLLCDIGASFIAPTIVLCLGFANSRLPHNDWDRDFRLRLTLIFSTSLFLFTICVLMFQDRIFAVDLWKESPIFYSIVYLVFVAITALGLGAVVHWKLRPSLWRNVRRKSDS